MDETDVYVPISSDGDGGALKEDSNGVRNGSILITGPRNDIPPSSNVVRDKLIKASCICAFFMTVEFFAGWFANSLALMTDASHLLSDLSAFVISLVSLWVADFPGTNQMSFGFHRAEILGALVSVLLIWVLTIGLIVEAFRRVYDPVPVNGKVMFITAVCGTLANLAMTRILGVHSHGIGGGVHNHDNNETAGNNGSCSSSHDHHHHHNNCGPSPSSHHHPHQPHNHDSLLNPGDSSEEVGTGGRHSARSLSPLERVSTGDSSHGAELHPHNHPQHVQEAAAVDDEDGSRTPPPAHYFDDETKNVNLRAAYVHALGDLIQNIGVLAASVVIWWKPTLAIVDPICTFFFSLLVLATTHSIFRDGMHVLMEGSPADLDIGLLREELLALAHVAEVHDLHVWCLSVGKPSLACHLVVDDIHAARTVLRKATLLCQRRFKILHTTIQIDFSAGKVACGTDAHSRCR